MTSSTPQSSGSHHPNWALIATFGIVAVVGGVVGGFVGYALHPGTASAATSTASGNSSSCSIPKIADDDLPTVVTISARKGSTGGTGSGTIIKSNGYILTNNHVVAVAADGGSVSVLFSNGKTADATIVGRDPLTDVAVIKVDESKLPVMSLGSSSNVVVGQTVIALGAPLGLSSTVTSGIVSALDRTIAVPGEGSESALLVDAVQTDASINPGNSGGALVNCAGQYIGMPSAGASVPTSSGESSGGSIGLNFAIPVDLASAEANEIISTGHVTHAYFGLTAVPLAPDASVVHGVSEGLLVTGVDPAGPAQKAGLKVGDIITTLNGKSVSSTDELVTLSLNSKPGDTVKVGYSRDGKSATTTLTLGTMPS